ncbi:bifunctional DNA primase/polymerase [Rhodococcus sp. F64268]|uniref:bifunctional DNA primase/polymerase n=1 Tax=Rhodococcus sp. F64268 TaxID=2926402 RepID=UPI001FF56ECE|nr:bifunctional DNA primase/polymerase [Rhodococcus sp. F64268]MCK0091215.1 bifunctional DNA primase/polymerase [Rhodococcus sp. F64268]
MTDNHPRVMLERGFALGPLDGKKAFLPGGFHAFTTDRDELNRLARQYPRCNWGGRREGVIVLDEDPRNGGNLDELGPDALDTLVVRTGSGGRHAYFRFDGKIRGKLADYPGIDLKSGRTGYTVMPGSVHPDTGLLYVIERNIEIKPLPQRLLPLVEPPKYVPQPTVVSPEKRSHGIVRKVSEAGEGDRNAMTFWAFCRALERGEQSLLDDIRAAAVAVGLDEREIETCLRSAQRTVGRAA